MIKRWRVNARNSNGLFRTKTFFTFRGAKNWHRELEHQMLIHFQYGDILDPAFYVDVKKWDGKVWTYVGTMGGNKYLLDRSI